MKSKYIIIYCSQFQIYLNLYHYTNSNYVYSHYQRYTVHTQYLYVYLSIISFIIFNCTYHLKMLVINIHNIIVYLRSIKLYYIYPQTIISSYFIFLKSSLKGHIIDTFILIGGFI